MVASSLGSSSEALKDSRPYRAHHTTVRHCLGSICLAWYMQQLFMPEYLEVHAAL